VLTPDNVPTYYVLCSECWEERYVDDTDECEDCGEFYEAGERLAPRRWRGVPGVACRPCARSRR